MADLLLELETQISARLGHPPAPRALQALRVRGDLVARARGLPLQVVYERALQEPLEGEHLLALAEALSVDESTFFRHPAQFEALERDWLPRWRSGGREGVRALSAACAKGEELYSLAITCERAWPGGDHRLHGFDMSPRALASAREGCYRPWSFRGVDLAGLLPWLEPCVGGHRVREPLKGLVRLSVGNVVEPPAEVRAAAPFDVIFCRNVLMYLTPSCAARAVERLRGLLAPDGLFLTGPADGTPALARPPPVRSADRPPAPAAPTLCPPVAQSGPPPPAPPVEEALAEYRALLALGREARDNARWEDALSLFDQAIALFPTRAQAYFDQGLLVDSRGLSAAAQALFERSLYLDAEFVPPLLPLARLLLGAGEPRRARGLLQQAEGLTRFLPPSSALAGWPEMKAGEILQACRALLARGGRFG
jgi:chemotaxis methyl-accepting protein methylase